MPVRRLLVSAASVFLVAIPTAPVVAQSTDAPVTGVRKELIAQIADAEEKFVSLAQATPAAKYGWRPAPKVRSVSEVYMHIVGANYMFPGIAGVKRAPDVALARDMETTTTDKAQIVDLLKKSFAFAKRGIGDVPDDQLDATVTMFGSPSTKRAVLLLMATHAHEHLGQAIAYARTNGVIPPWSQAGRGGDR